MDGDGDGDEGEGEKTDEATQVYWGDVEEATRPSEGSIVTHA